MRKNKILGQVNRKNIKIWLLKQLYPKVLYICTLN